MLGGGRILISLSESSPNRLTLLSKTWRAGWVMLVGRGSVGAFKTLAPSGIVSKISVISPFSAIAETNETCVGQFKKFPKNYR